MGRCSTRLVSPAMDALRQIDGWGAEHAATAVVRPNGVVARHGPEDHVFRWASVTSLRQPSRRSWPSRRARSTWTSRRDRPARPYRRLLAHASGLPFDDGPPIGVQGERRIYSNQGYEALAAHVRTRTEIPFPEYLAAAVFRPLGMGSELRGSAGADVHGSLADLELFAVELLGPTLIAPETLAEATSIQFPGPDGVLPGVGRSTPRLGPRLRLSDEVRSLDRYAHLVANVSRLAAGAPSSGSTPSAGSRSRA